MPPVLIVEHQPVADALFGLGRTIIGFEIDLLMFQSAPEALDKHIVHPASLAIHADLDVRVFGHISEVLTGELAALVGVKDIRCAMGRQGLLQCFNARRCIQAVGQTPTQYLSGMPIHHGHHIPKAFAQRNIRDVSAPNLVHSINRQISQQIGVDLVLPIRTGRSGARMQCAYPH